MLAYLFLVLTLVIVLGVLLVGGVLFLFMILGCKLED